MKIEEFWNNNALSEKIRIVIYSRVHICSFADLMFSPTTFWMKHDFLWYILAVPSTLPSLSSHRPFHSAAHKNFYHWYLANDIVARIREQMSGPDLYVLTVAFLALKKPGFSEKKNSSQKKIIFFYLFSMQLFSADATMFSNFFFIS